MTLVIVDQHRMSADTYCTITAPDGSVTVEDNYSKIHPLPFQVILPSGETTFTTVGFCGDPVTFIEIYEAMLALGEEFTTVTTQQLMDLRFTDQGSGQVIIPFPCGAASFIYRNGRMYLPKERHGETLGFGSVYDGLETSGGTDNRVWYSIFLDAISDERLPGANITYRHHDTVVDMDKHATASTVRAPEAKRSYRAINRLYKLGRKTGRG